MVKEESYCLVLYRVKEQSGRFWPVWDRKPNPFPLRPAETALFLITLSNVHFKVERYGNFNTGIQYSKNIMVYCYNFPGDV